MPGSQTGWPYGAPGQLAILEYTASFTLTNEHFSGGVVIEVNSAVNVTVTVPAGLTTPNEVAFIRTGTGGVTFAAASGAVLRSAAGALTLAQQYSAASLIPAKSADTFTLVGDLA